VASRDGWANDKLHESNLRVATIFYSIAGEGRGHATRVRAIVEALRREHRFTLFASGAAYEFLSEVYAGTPGVFVHAIAGVKFRYRGQRVHYLKTLLCELPLYLWHLRRTTAAIEETIRRESPDLAITDFEPLLPRAAKRCGLPFLSVDHQHFLVTSDLSSLAPRLRGRAWLIGLGVRCFYWGQRQTIVSSFFFPPLRRGFEKVVQAGILLRPEVLAAVPRAGKHLVVYVRKFFQKNLLEALRTCGREVWVYGVGPKPGEGRIHFRQISETGFLEDLATCDALITNGGNQVIGEAHHLGKPVLSLPESGNFEQEINAHFLRESGGGDAIPYEELDPARLLKFLGRCPEYRSRICRDDVNGNDRVVEAIRGHLPRVVSAPVLCPAVRVA
jgi:uncharacterized protein (TIGR00661 family)